MSIELIKEVAASTDDAEVRSDDSGGYSDSGDDLRLGKHYNISGESMTNGFRFLNITIPAGSTIDTAVMSFWFSADSASVSVKIYGEDADDSVTFSSGDSPYDRTKTTESVTWNCGGGGTGERDSPDITDVIQEIIDRGSWASGNDLSIIFADNASPDWTGSGVETYDKGNDRPYPTLTITYTEPVPITCSTDLITVDDTKSHYLSFTLKVTSYTSGAVSWNIDEYDSSNVLLQSQAASSKSEAGVWRIAQTYTPTDSSVAKVKLVISTGASDVLTAYVDLVELFEVNADANGAKVTICFDDGKDSVYTNRFIFSSRGVPVTQFIVSDWVSTAGFQTWTQIKDTYDNFGWEIGNHGKTSISLDTASEATIVTEISTCQTAVNTNVGVTPTNLAWPNGAYDDLAKQVASRYVRGMRDYHGYAINGLNVAPYPDISLYGTQVENTHSVADVKGYIDDAITDGDWLILAMHELVASSPTQYQWTVSDMEEVLDYIQTKVGNGDIDAVTMEGGRNLLVAASAPIKTPAGVKTINGNFITSTKTINDTTIANVETIVDAS